MSVLDTAPNRMEEQITNLLSIQPKEMEAHVHHVHSLINQYELQSYASSSPDKDLIAKWLRMLRESIIASTQKEEPIINRRDDAEDKQLFDTLSLMVSQVDTADQNILLLSESSVKLKSLCYNSKALEKELHTARNVIARSRANEMKEIRRVWIGIFIYLGVCVYILLGRIGLFKFIVYLVMKLINFGN
ncbi:putative Sec20 protein [Trachipleistophora hominis]|uniref:Putative Sec20 protein n=1 Tax=Trachipleistophora hominis TaxID=72359 RepID=L7JR38_TRAHO|nr:putative Sec20 protein [Trachipleistophora hominis]